MQLLIESFAAGLVQLGIEPQHVFLAGGDELLIKWMVHSPGDASHAAACLEMNEYVLLLLAGRDQTQVKTNSEWLHVGGFHARARTGQLEDFHRRPTRHRWAERHMQVARSFARLKHRSQDTGHRIAGLSGLCTRHLLRDIAGQ